MEAYIKNKTLYVIAEDKQECEELKDWTHENYHEVVDMNINNDYNTCKNVKIEVPTLMLDNLTDDEKKELINLLKIIANMATSYEVIEDD